MTFLNSLSIQREDEPESKVLYVVGTPIGNLNDISSRSKKILSEVSFIACEDTRHTKKLLNALNIKNTLICFNEFNSEIKTNFIIEKLKEGLSVALVTDAGLPAISDPGEYLIKHARLSKLEVICSPGPCAALTALVSSGLKTNHFTFLGFLPKKGKERDKYLKIISENCSSTIIYESPKRLKELLKDLRKYCEDSRVIHIAKELTKKHESHFNGPLYKVIESLENNILRGEFTVVIEGNESKNNSKINYIEIKNDLKNLILLGLKRSSAASYLSKKYGISKNSIYNLD